MIGVDNLKSERWLKSSDLQFSASYLCLKAHDLLNRLGYGKGKPYAVAALPDKQGKVFESESHALVSDEFIVAKSLNRDGYFNKPYLVTVEPLLGGFVIILY